MENSGEARVVIDTRTAQYGVHHCPNTRAALIKAKDDMARYYNHHCTMVPKFNAGNCVFLDGTDLKTTCPLQKLSHRFHGPYLVVRVVGPHMY